VQTLTNFGNGITPSPNRPKPSPNRPLKSRLHSSQPEDDVALENCTANTAF